jgi:DNA-directed RNA polymerase specialized sigma subunit
MITPTLPGATTGTAAESLRLIKIYQCPRTTPLAKRRAGQRLCLTNDKYVLKRVHVLLQSRFSDAVKKHGPNLIDDVASSARMGFAETLTRFDPGEGYALLTYSTHYIDRAIVTAVNTAGLMSRKSVSERLSTLYSKTTLFTKEFGRMPTDEELSEITGFPLAAITRLKLYGDTVAYVVSLDKPSTFDPELSLLDTITAPPLSNDSDDYLWTLVTRHAGSQMGMDIMRMRYYDDMAFAAIGEKLGITRQRASQYHERIIKKLRAYSASL